MQATTSPLFSRIALAAAWVLLGAPLLALGGCGSMAATMPASAPLPAHSSATTNRPDGEGYAGVGELLVRISVHQQGSNWATSLTDDLVTRQERAYVEIRYQGMDSLGRAVFERRDGDALAAATPNTALATSAKGTVLVPAPVGSNAGGNDAASAAPTTPNTRDIALDLRLSRQIHVQGKIVEVLEATTTGVVFRLY